MPTFGLCSNLEDNDITTIDSTTFLDQSQILILNLGQNSLESLPTGLLAPLVNMQILYVHLTSA